MLLRLIRRAWAGLYSTLSLVELLVIGVLLVMLLTAVVSEAARWLSRRP